MKRRTTGTLALLLALHSSAPALAQSLMARSGKSLYSADTVPDIEYKVNDLILILVEETGSAKNDSNTNLRRTFDLTAELSEWFEIDGFLDLDPADPTGLPSLDLQTEKRQEGRGTTDRSDRIRFKITARVVDVRPNGNLVIEGRTSRRVNDEENILTIFGEVNPDDVDSKVRAVKSERIADMKLIYSGRGPVSRNQGRTFFSWLLEWVWPF